jgi:DHA3 family tetracycline resistance protein-like MFS transporter
VSQPPAYRVYLWLVGGTGFFFWTWAAMSALYRIREVGLNPLQLVLVGTALEVSAFVFEIPTGVVADTVSRRLSVIVGTAIIGVGFILEGAVPVFSVVLLAQVIWGLGFTFTSGATEAWLADELQDDVATARALLRGTQVRQLASLMGIVAAVALASVDLSLPLIVGGIGYLLVAVGLMVFMPETGFHRVAEAERDTWHDMKATLDHGIALVRRNRVLVALFGAVFFFGAFSEAFDRLWEALILTDFEFPSFPNWSVVVWFGVIDAVAMLLSIFVAGAVRKRVTAGTIVHIPALLTGLALLLSAAVIGLGLAGQFAVAVALYQAAILLRVVHGPLLTAWLNEQLESRSRATVLSMQSQSDALGQVVGGPILGWIATAVSLSVAFVVAGVFLMPAVLLYAWGARRDRRDRAEPVLQLDMEDDSNPG